MTFDNDNRVYPINCKKDFIFNYGLSAGTMDKFIKQIPRSTLSFTCFFINIRILNIIPILFF